MTKQKLIEEFDNWYKAQKEMNPYIMRDYFLSQRDKEYQDLLEFIAKDRYEIDEELTEETNALRISHNQALDTVEQHIKSKL